MRRRDAALGQLGLAQGAEGLDHPLQLVLGRAVAAVGVRVAALDQLDIAGPDRLRLGAGVQVEVGQGAALDLADLALLRRLFGAAPGGSEQAEGIGEGAVGG